MTTFWDLLKQSVIVQAILTLLLWSAIVYLVVKQMPVPDILSAGGMGILGFWFGTKVQSSIAAQAAPPSG